MCVRKNVCARTRYRGRAFITPSCAPHAKDDRSARLLGNFAFLEAPPIGLSFRANAPAFRHTDFRCSKPSAPFLPFSISQTSPAPFLSLVPIAPQLGSDTPSACPYAWLTPCYGICNVELKQHVSFSPALNLFLKLLAQYTEQCCHTVAYL